MWKILNICLLVFFWGLTNSAFSQSDSTFSTPQKSISPSLRTSFQSDSAGDNMPSLQKKSSDALADSLAESLPDSLSLSDTLSDAFEPSADTLPFIGNSPSALTSIVHYQAEDSISFDVNKRKAQLYTKGVIEYDGMELKADEIRVDFNSQMLYAQHVTDSNGKPIGRPFFKEGDAEYMADTIAFNYNTKKGIISGVITQQGDGFLHGSAIP